MIRIQSKLDGNRVDTTWQQPGYLFFTTQLGTVKKTALEDFGNVRKGGIIAIGIEPGDTLIDVQLTSGTSEMVLITRGGMSIRFAEEEVRSMGRPAGGVKGITLDAGDRVVAASIVVPDATLLVAGENGIGKRTAFDEYRAQSRGGKGIITMKTGDKTGDVVGALAVRQQDELMLITTKGQMVRTRVNEIRETARNTMGVILIRLRTGEKLQSIAMVVSQEEEEAEEAATPPEEPTA